MEDESEMGRGPRRSERPQKKRIVIVNGNPVRWDNMYTIEEGGISVLQEKERILPEGAVLSPEKRKAKKVAAPAEQRAKPELSEALKERQRWHGELSAEMVRASEKQYATFASFLNILAPFISDSVSKKLKEEGKRVAAAGVTVVPRQKTIEQPECIQGTMRTYQLEGLAFMVSSYENGLSAILADEMGLGKTLQTISFLGHLKFDRNVSGPHLVVCPLSVLGSWKKELARWCPGLSVFQLHSSDANERERIRKILMKGELKFDIVLTTYEIVLSANMKRLLQSTIHWRYLVLDEGHKVKNENTLIADAVRHIKRQATLLLTGTPVQNDLHELWALLSVLHPTVFTDPTPFDVAFNLSQDPKKANINRGMLDKARLLLNKFCLRRLKADVEKSLPPKTETKIFCPLSKMQHFWYRRLLLKESRLLAQLEANAAGDFAINKEENAWKKLLMLMMQLRKCANHPYMFPGAEMNPEKIGEDIVHASGKMQLLDRLLKKLQSAGHRVVIFSQFTRMLDIIEDFVDMREYKFLRIDGSTNRVQREVNIRLFNAANSEFFIFLLSTRAGGLGVNLQTADTVILFDSDWNPQVDIQAMARVHRIGQTKPVHTYRLVTNGTVEEGMQARAEKKLYLDQMVNRRGTDDEVEDIADASRYELLSMVHFGAEALIKTAETEELTDEDLDLIIDRTRIGATTSGKEECSKLQSCQQNAADFHPQLQGTSSRIFEGIDYRGECTIADIADQWVNEVSKRNRISTTIEIDGYKVRRINNYHLNEGEPSVFNSELRPGAKETMSEQKHKRKRIDYQHDDQCLYCWDGGFLVLCDACPASYHLECLGMTEADLGQLQKFSGWRCPHHECSICYRKASAVGGMLFRCEVCPNAYCDEHLPEDADIVQQCERFEELGYDRPSQACFVHCSTDCIAFAAKLARGEDIYASQNSKPTPSEPKPHAKCSAHPASTLSPIDLTGQTPKKLGCPSKSEKTPPLVSCKKEKHTSTDLHNSVPAAKKQKLDASDVSPNGHTFSMSQEKAASSVKILTPSPSHNKGTKLPSSNGIGPSAHNEEQPEFPPFSNPPPSLPSIPKKEPLIVS